MANIDATRDAREELRRRWEAADKPTGEFRPRTRKAKRGDGWVEMVCVDASGRLISGVKAVRFRAVITGRVEVPSLEQ